MATDKQLLDQARANRKEMNHSETRLWWDLRRQQFGVRFRRQHIALGYILDFACLSLKLNVEVDGYQHHESESDRIRDRRLRQAGWTILRFRSPEIFDNNETVLHTIGVTIDRLKHR